METVFSFQWRDSSGQHGLTMETRNELLSKIEKFLRRGYDFRVIIRAKDSSSKDEIAKLFKKYERKYTTKTPSNKKSHNSPNAELQILEEGARGVIEGAKYAGGASAVLTAVELTPSAARDMASFLGEQLGPEFLAEQLGSDFLVDIASVGAEFTAEALAELAGSSAIEALANAAEIAVDVTAPFLFHVGIIAGVSIRGYRMYQKDKREKEKAWAKQKEEEEKAVLIFTFKNEKSSDLSNDNSPFPGLSPIKPNLFHKLFDSLSPA